MILYYGFFNESSLTAAVKKGNIDIVQLLLNIPNINVNEITIFFFLFPI